MQIAKGAEAELNLEDGVVVKDRIKKGYRLPELDEKLRKRRTSNEAKLLREARRAGVLTPQVLEEDKTTLKLEFIDGKKVKDVLNAKNCKAICEEVGRCVALLQSYDIIHGDLTTSNMIIKIAGELDSKVKKKPAISSSNSSFSIYFIDFGLGSFSKRDEDKAIDLYLLREALESTHFLILEEAWKSVIEAYKSNYQDSNKVIKALSDVEKRGRYKERSK